MTSSTGSKEIDNGRIWKVGLLAMGASLVANLVLYGLVSAIYDLPANFPPLSVGAITFLTALFTFLAVVVFAIVARVARRPIRTYRIIATVALVLSIVPNIMSAMNLETIPFPFPGATTQAFLVLILFHVVAYLVTVGMLTTMTIKK